MLQWMHTNQVLAVFLISAIVNLLVDGWSKWFGSPAETDLERRSGLWAGLAVIIRAGGIDVVKILQGVGQVLSALARSPKGPAVLLLVGLGAGRASASPGDLATEAPRAKALDAVVQPNGGGGHAR